VNELAGDVCRSRPWPGVVFRFVVRRRAGRCVAVVRRRRTVRRRRSRHSRPGRCGLLDEIEALAHRLYAFGELDLVHLVHLGRSLCLPADASCRIFTVSFAFVGRTSRETNRQQCLPEIPGVPSSIGRDAQQSQPTRPASGLARKPRANHGSTTDNTRHNLTNQPNRSCRSVVINSSRAAPDDERGVSSGRRPTQRPEDFAEVLERAAANRVVLGPICQRGSGPMPSTDVEMPWSIQVHSRGDRF
jgi:hypothetical protein